MEINFTQPVFRGGRTIAGTDKARSSVRAALALLNAKEQDVMYRAGAAYMDVLRDQSVLELQEKNKAVIARELESTKIRFEAGELTRTDVAQAEARLAAAESARVRALGNLMSGKAMYEEIVGRPAEKLTAPPPGFLSLPESAEQSVEAAERANPELEAAEHLHKSTKQQAREILGELLPELGLFGSWNRQYDPQPGLLKDSTDKTIGIRASMPLFRGGANASRVREARHEANEKYMEIMQARRRVHQEAVTAWETLRAARSEKQARASQVKASEIAREGVHQETDLGARTVLDALDADRELLDARVALITAERDEIIAALDLARITGMLTPSGLGFRETSDVSRHAGTPSGWPLTGFGVDIMGETD